MTWSAIVPGVISASIAATVAALGWFVAARQNYRYAHLLDLQREKRNAEGHRNILVADLRTIAIRLRPWFFTFTSVNVDDLLPLYQTLLNDLRDKDFAKAISPVEYTALFALLDRFGRDVAYQQSLLREALESDPTRDEDLRQKTVVNFTQTAWLLVKASKALGAEDLTNEAKDLLRAANAAAASSPYGRVMPEDDE